MKKNFVKTNYNSTTKDKKMKQNTQYIDGMIVAKQSMMVELLRDYLELGKEVDGLRKAKGEDMDYDNKGSVPLGIAESIAQRYSDLMALPRGDSDRDAMDQAGIEMLLHTIESRLY